MANIGYLDLRLYFCLDFHIRQFCSIDAKHLFDLFRLDIDNALDECSDVILAQVIDIVVPVAHPALLLPSRQLSWIDPPEVTHVDIEARPVGQVSCTSITTMHDPGLPGVDHTVHEKYNIERTLVLYPIELNQVPVLSFALIPRMLVTRGFNQVSDRSRVNIALHKCKWPLDASFRSFKRLAQCICDEVRRLPRNVQRACYH